MPVATENRWRSLAWFFRAAQVRLRFLAALVVAFLIVARWDVIRTYWDRWTAPSARDASMGAVSADTEYFCPMDPGVLSGWPGQCPICHMALVRRSKGDMGPLPSGVIARVQLSPDRILLAGIRSEPVYYRALTKDVRTVGLVVNAPALATIRAEIGGDEASWLEPGQSAEVAADPPDGSVPVAGKVRAIEASSDGAAHLVVEILDPPAAIRSARFASIVVRALIAGREPFRSMPRGEPPIRAGEPRAFHTCADHPDLIRFEAGRCPKDEKPLDRLDLAKNQRVAWWCPMHPKVVADRASSECSECGGMQLVPRVVSYCPIGEVLAVPESAVIDTGSRMVVYVERMPGMFDGVEVRLGPRSGGFYPVVEGLEPGQAVAVTGAFLVDAETRLNPSLAAGYFGARRPEVAASKPEAPAEKSGLAGLAPIDRELAIAQATCPVTGKALGSMGTPIRVVVRGRPVFLCCSGCAGAIGDAPEKYLAKLKAPAPAHHP
jgi:membrane fusion protein, copper/silver efflux system